MALYNGDVLHESKYRRTRLNYKECMQNRLSRF